MTLTAKERRGANIEIYKVKPKMEGTPWETSDIKGELIAVKENSLLLLDSEGEDVSVDINELYAIKIVKKSGAWIGGGIGLATGAIVSIPLVKGFAELDGSTPSSGDYIIGALLAGAIFAFPGVLIGGFFGKDETIQIAGKSDSEIKKALEELCKKARIPDFQ